jgi:hypothetical protein
MLRLIDSLEIGQPFYFVADAYYYWVTNS